MHTNAKCERQLSCDSMLGADMYLEQQGCSNNFIQNNLKTDE